MADHHEIDEFFKGRFDGVKDHRYDPSKQWSVFESQLEAAMAGSASVGAGSASAGFSAWSIAASVASIMVMTGLVSQDRSALPSAQEEARSIRMTQIEATWNTAESATWSTASFGTNEAVPDDASDLASMTHNASDPVSSFTEAGIESRYDAATTQESFASWYAEDASSGSELAAAGGRMFDGLQRMPVLDVRADIEGINDRAMPDRLDASLFRKHGAFLRLAMRTGNGESNSNSDPAKWRLNGLAAVGYSYAFNSKTFITAEIGLLRRSGNGIERSKDVDLEPLANVLLNNFGGATEQEMELRRSFMNVRESFVAQRLDYIHMPIALHVNLTTHSNASVGTFVDYLVGVENESYMVYNGVDYIKADFGLNDRSTMEGLNRWRLGLMAGYEHSISQHVTLDARAMLPITSVFDRSSVYYQHAEPNQLVDIQLGLSYKI